MQNIIEGVCLLLLHWKLTNAAGLDILTISFVVLLIESIDEGTGTI